MSPAYYNENEPYAAAWLRNLIARGLIAEGEVDERSITEVQASDLRGFTLLRGIGNAIVAPLAAEFVKAWMDL